MESDAPLQAFGWPGTGSVTALPAKSGADAQYRPCSKSYQTHLSARIQGHAVELLIDRERAAFHTGFSKR